MKTLYKHVVGTPRSGGKKGYETSVIGRQEREKSTKYYIFHKLLRSVFLKQFPNNSKSTQIISRKTDVSRCTHMCLNITYGNSTCILVCMSAPGNINS